MPEWRLRRYNVLAQKTVAAPLRASLCRGAALQVRYSLLIPLRPEKQPQKSRCSRCEVLHRSP